MATPDITAAQILTKSAALLNDQARQIYTNSNMLPYLNLALQELQEQFELNNVPVTDTITSNPIDINAGVSSVGFNSTPPAPELPDDLIEPKIVWERQAGIDPYTQMGRLDYLPRYMEGVEINQLLFYVWQSQELRFLPANADNQIKIDYIRNLFTEITNVADNINVVNAATYLEFETASLCAWYIGENKSRADALAIKSEFAIDRALGIGAKGRQRIKTRRRPFRANYKRRTYM